jgi:hypothetical protein
MQFTQRWDFRDRDFHFPMHIVIEATKFWAAISNRLVQLILISGGAIFQKTLKMVVLVLITALVVAGKLHKKIQLFDISRVHIRKQYYCNL